MRILYFDCIAGISGDMALAALVDAGADFKVVRDHLASLPVEAFDIEIEDVETHGIAAKRVHVHAETAGVIRTYANIRSLLDQAEFPPEARSLAQRIFRRLAEAEAAVHRREIEQVTFHEIGAVDSIADICGTALAVTLLGVERVFSSAVPTGFGVVKTQHGSMPIPAPAVVELLRGAPMYSRGVPMELVTPTGAAILASLVEGFGEMPSMRSEAIGYGAGTPRTDFANILRVMIGDADPAVATPAIERRSTGEVVLETNLDDLNPELYEYVLERLFAAGANDAWLTPIVMKKSRPAVTISVLCAPQRVDAIKQVLFRETGTLGIRATTVDKQALDRDWIEVDTRGGTVRVKVGVLDGRPVSVSPEFEDCTKAAREAGVPAREIYEEAIRLARATLAD